MKSENLNISETYEQISTDIRVKAFKALEDVDGKNEILMAYIDNLEPDEKEAIKDHLLKHDLIYTKLRNLLDSLSGESIISTSSVRDMMEEAEKLNSIYFNQLKEIKDLLSGFGYVVPDSESKTEDEKNKTETNVDTKTLETRNDIKDLSSETLARFNELNILYKQLPENEQESYSDIYEEAVSIYQSIMKEAGQVTDDKLDETLEKIQILFSDFSNRNQFIIEHTVGGDTLYEEEADVEDERKRLMDYFNRWKRADTSLLNDGWINHLYEIKDDLRKILSLAGYAKDDIDLKFKQNLNPWSENVYSIRKNVKDVSERSRAFKEARNQIFNVMANYLRGKKLDEVVLDKVVGINEYQNTSPVNEDFPDEIKEEPRDLTELNNQLKFLYHETELIAGSPITNIAKELIRELADKLDKIEEAKVFRVKLMYLSEAKSIFIEIKQESEKSSSTISSSPKPIDLILETRNDIKDLSSETLARFNELNILYKQLPENEQESYSDIYEEAVSIYQSIMKEAGQVTDDKLDETLEKIQILFSDFSNRNQFIIEHTVGGDTIYEEEGQGGVVDKDTLSQKYLDDGLQAYHQISPETQKEAHKILAEVEKKQKFSNSILHILVPEFVETLREDLSLRDFVYTTLTNLLNKLKEESMISGMSEEEMLSAVLDLKNRYQSILEGISNKFDDWRPKADDLADANKVKDAPAPVVSSEGLGYKDKREHWSIKEEFRTKEKEYKEAMAEYYDSISLKSRFGSAVSGVKKFFSSSSEPIPELPPELQEMKNEYKKLRASYATSLDSALSGRAKNSEKINYNFETDSTKIAFAKKFILKPGQEIQKMQELNLLSPENQARLAGLMKIMSKHKWTARIGVVTAAGVAGAISGGVGLALAGASWKAAKIAASAGVGLGAGALAKKVTQGGVDKAKKGVEEKSKEFTLADLDSFEDTISNTFEDDSYEEILLKAQSQKKKAEKIQKIATIGAGALAGGLTGYGLGHIPDSEMKAIDISSEEYNPERIPVKGIHEPVIEKVTPQTVAEVNHSNVVTGKIEKNNLDALAELGIDKPKVPEFGPKVSQVSVSSSMPNGVSRDTVMSDMKLVGNFKEGSISNEQLEKINNDIKLAANGLLEAHPNMSEAKLESEIFGKLQGKYGETSWWKEADVSKLDIGEITYKVNPFSVPDSVSEVPISSDDVMNSGSDPINDNIIDDAAEPTVKHTHLVKSGENLSTILHKNLLEQLDQKAIKLPEGVTRAELSKLMYQKFPELTNAKSPTWTLSPSEWKEIGVSSSDPSLIKPGDNISIDKLMEKVLDPEVKPGQSGISQQSELPLRPKTGALPIIHDSAEKVVPIQVPVMPDEFGVPNASSDTMPVYTEMVPATGVSNIISETGRVYSEAAHSAEVVANSSIDSAPPRPFSLSGNYAQTDSYKSYIKLVFGENLKLFNQAVSKAAEAVDNETYDFFDKSSIFGSGYQSPYNFLKEMTLKDIEKFDGAPNDEIRSLFQKENIKYDTYLAWMDKIDEMKKTLPFTENTKLSDLFSRWVAEHPTPKANTYTRNL